MGQGMELFGVQTEALLALNNIELITDRPLRITIFKKLSEVKRDWPDRALVTSLMVPCEETYWEEMLKKVEDTEVTVWNLILVVLMECRKRERWVQLVWTSTRIY